MRYFLKTFLAAAIAALLYSCDTGDSSSGNSCKVRIGNETFKTEGAFAFWWISSDDSGRPWSNYEIILLPCASFDGYDDAEWDFYFDCTSMKL